MNGMLFTIVTIAVVMISILEWSKLKKKPMRERVIFVLLLLLVWFLCMLDLPHTMGPTRVLAFIFKPLEGLVEH
jgi:CDP-diglyceride synthetase